MFYKGVIINPTRQIKGLSAAIIGSDGHATRRIPMYLAKCNIIRTWYTTKIARDTCYIHTKWNVATANCRFKRRRRPRAHAISFLASTQVQDSVVRSLACELALHPLLTRFGTCDSPKIKLQIVETFDRSSRINLLPWQVTRVNLRKGNTSARIIAGLRGRISKAHFLPRTPLANGISHCYMHIHAQKA